MLEQLYYSLALVSADVKSFVLLWWSVCL